VSQLSEVSESGRDGQCERAEGESAVHSGEYYWNRSRRRA
jgi:hypothetical protein